MNEVSVPRKRLVYQVKLSPQAGQKLEGLSWEMNMPKRTLLARLVTWFCQQRPVVRQLIVDAIPPDEAPAAARQALSETN